MLFKLLAALLFFFSIAFLYTPNASAQFSSNFDLTGFGNYELSGSASEAVNDTVPHPRKVMIRSAILPGWGQHTNRQAWKIPIVYGLIGGLSYYAYFAHTRYEGYRAAFYNSNPDNTDFRFGPTPGWIQEGAPAQFYRTSRDFYRNRRDFLIVTVFLSYILNVVDAYVFAHMRDFDVSDDLSARIKVEPATDLVYQPNIGLTMQIRF